MPNIYSLNQQIQEPMQKLTFVNTQKIKSSNIALGIISVAKKNL